MTDEPTKPAGGADGGEEPRPVEERQAVKNQGEVAPDDYPERDLLDPNGATGGRDK